MDLGRCGAEGAGVGELVCVEAVEELRVAVSVCPWSVRRKY